MIMSRTQNTSVQNFYNPSLELNLGLWILFAGATFFLALRIWIKITRRHGLWWDDYILLASWAILAANNSLISFEYASNFVTPKWNDRTHILINITSCGTLINQALSKTAFAVTLLKLTERWMKTAVWACILIMNAYMMIKVVFQWAKVCGDSSYDVWYRLPFCLNPTFRNDFKIGGNVFNVIMDFVFASIPWIITWKLTMSKVDKIGLNVTMSLGMAVAIIAAVRINWKDEGNQKDQFYFKRIALSNIWYSSEIVGTIVVQCIPVLRPLIRDFHTTMMSRKLSPTADFPELHTEPLVELEPSTTHTTQVYSSAENMYSNGNCGSSASSDKQGIHVRKDFHTSTVESNSRQSGCSA